ncbi:MAG: Ig-like domain-containing protein, partial [Armatimonadota bacterium]
MTTAQPLKISWKLGRRAVFCLLLLLVSVAAWAQNGTVKASAFPSLALSDGSSPVIITVEVRDQNGQLVPDGTPVVFESKIGNFDAQTVNTQNGLAKATLHAPSTPGFATIRISVLRFNAFGETAVEFVKERGKIESSLRQLEVEGGSSLTYSVQDRVFEATGVKRTAVVRLGKVEVAADEFQVHAIDTTVKAHEATLKINGLERNYEELSFNLKNKIGVGLTTVTDPGRFVKTGSISLWVPGRTHLGYVDITADGETPRKYPPDPDMFRFVPVVDSLSLVSANRATVVLDRSIQFQHATVRMGGEVLMKVPLFDYPLTASSNLISEQFLQVNNSQIALNFPYYVTLNPGSTSLFRMRYSSPFIGGTSGYNAGTYLDYEMNWNQGDSGNGSMTVGGIGRDDWGVSLRQSWLTPKSTIITAAVDTPSHESLLANFGINQPLRGGNASIAYGVTRSLLDSESHGSGLSAIVQTDSRKLGSSPFRFATGITASANDQFGSGYESHQTLVGMQTRLNMDPINLNGLGRLRFNYVVSELLNSGQWGTAHAATVGLSTQFQQGFVLDTQYDYTLDPFTSSFLGRHRITADSYYTKGAWSLRGS